MASPHSREARAAAFLADLDDVAIGHGVMPPGFQKLGTARYISRMLTETGRLNLRVADTTLTPTPTNPEDTNHGL